MAFITASSYSEAANGDFPAPFPTFGPIFGLKTTISGTVSPTDRDYIIFDIQGTGLEDDDHPRTLPLNTPIDYTVQLTNADDFQISAGDLQRTEMNLGGTATLSGTFTLTSGFRLYMQLSAFGSSAPGPTGYSITLGAAAAHINLGTLGPGSVISQTGSIPAGQDDVVYDFRVNDPLTLYNLKLTGPDVQGLLEADPANHSPTLGPGPERHLFADQGFGSNPQVIEDPLMPGLYHYTVSRNGVGTATAPFSLTSDRLAQDEAGNNTAWAHTIPVATSSGSNTNVTKGTLTTVDNKDVYKFTLAEQSSVLVSLAVQGKAITQDGVPPIHYEVARSDGSLVLESHTDAVSNFIDTSFTTHLVDPSNTTPPEPGDYYNSDPNNVPLDPGDYTITVYKSGVTATPDNYQLWVNAWPDGAANRPTVESFGAEGPDSAVIGDLTNTTYTHHDFLGLADRNDFFVFYVTQRSQVTFNLTNPSSDVSINLNLGGLPYHQGQVPSDPLAIPTPDPIVSDIGPFNDIRPGGGGRSFSAVLDPGIYDLRAYTETSFSDPNGTEAFGSTLVYPKDGGAFYDLQITSQTVTPPPVLANQSSFGTVTHDGHSPGGQVYALYDGLLGRAPDVGGLEYWADQFAHGVAPATLAAGFLASPEGQARQGAADNGAFVTQLYNATLHRGPDDGGLGYWTGQLAGGMSRADVGVGFALSDEHLGNIKGALDAGVFVPDLATSQAARLYYTVLDRAPDAGGLQYWANLIKTGAATLDTETATFLATPEVQGKTAGLSTRDYVSMVYDNALGRAPDDGGLDYWVHSIDVDHQSRVAVTTTIGQSPEAQAHLAPDIELGWHLA